MTAPRYLLPGEEPRVNVRRHWAALLVPGMKAAAILAVLLVLWLNTGNATLAGMLDMAMLGLLGWFGWRAVEWRHDRFVVTDKRVLLVTGVLTNRIGMMPLLKVTDMTYERSWLGRQLHYGAFVMESAGQDQALHRVDYVPYPEQVSQTMFTLLFGAPGGGALPNDRDPHPDPIEDPHGHLDADQDYPTDPHLPAVSLPERLPWESSPSGDRHPREGR